MSAELSVGFLLQRFLFTSTWMVFDTMCPVAPSIFFCPVFRFTFSVSDPGYVYYDDRGRLFFLGLFDFPLAVARDRYLVLLVECSHYQTDYLSLFCFLHLTIDSLFLFVFTVFLDVQVLYANDIYWHLSCMQYLPPGPGADFPCPSSRPPGQSMPTAQLAHQYE